jgi:hypothetical protein
MTGYQALANAIIIQAAKDYKAAVRLLKRHPDSRSGMDTAMEIERFFHSPWYNVLTNVDPDYLIQKLREEAVK